MTQHLFWFYRAKIDPTDSDFGCTSHGENHVVDRFAGYNDLNCGHPGCYSNHGNCTCSSCNHRAFMVMLKDVGATTITTSAQFVASPVITLIEDAIGPRLIRRQSLFQAFL